MRDNVSTVIVSLKGCVNAIVRDITKKRVR